MKGHILSVRISLSVYSASPRQGKHFILHFYAWPHASPGFPRCVCDCKNVEYFYFQNAYISISQEKDSKLTPTSSMNRWTFSPKPSSYFMRCLIWAENKGMIKTSQLGPFRWPQWTPAGVLCVELLSYSYKTLEYTLQPAKLVMWNTAHEERQCNSLGKRNMLIEIPCFNVSDLFHELGCMITICPWM